MADRAWRERLERLRALDGEPDVQLQYALNLVAKERNPEVLRAAIDVLAGGQDPAVRPALLARYEYCDANGVRRDPGGTIRIAILRALRPIALPEDASVLERAVTTYEFLYGEAAGDLRAEGLLALSDLDERLAGYHAVRLLTDEYTSELSGEPALTAVRVLASQEQYLPLYSYVSRSTPGVSDVVGESLRHLVAIPEGLLPPLIERYEDSDDEIVLLGLFDLLLSRPNGEPHLEFILDFVRTTTIFNIHRYLVNALVSDGHPETIAGLRRIEEEEDDRRRQLALREALSLR